MRKYIEVSKVIDYADQEITGAFYYPQDEQKKQDEQAYRDKWAFVKQVMVSMPAADVEEVRHGNWVYEKGDCFPKCSVCGQHHGTLFEYWYCPVCGAKMSLGE